MISEGDPRGSQSSQSSKSVELRAVRRGGSPRPLLLSLLTRGLSVWFPFLSQLVSGFSLLAKSCGAPIAEGCPRHFCNVVGHLSHNPLTIRDSSLISLNAVMNLSNFRVSWVNAEPLQDRHENCAKRIECFLRFPDIQNAQAGPCPKADMEVSPLGSTCSGLLKLLDNLIILASAHRGRGKEGCDCHRSSAPFLYSSWETNFPHVNHTMKVPLWMTRVRTDQKSVKYQSMVCFLQRAGSTPDKKLRRTHCFRFSFSTRYVGEPKTPLFAFCCQFCCQKPNRTQRRRV